MKKKILVILAAAIMIFAFTACGTNMADSPYLGTWTATTGEYSGISISVESAVGGEFSFVLNDDGSCDAVIGDQKESGSWTETDDGFCVEDEYTMVVDGDVGTMEAEGVTFNFERK